jgi:tetratricopeptide (TPR) repeat protein
MERRMKRFLKPILTLLVLALALGLGASRAHADQGSLGQAKAHFERGAREYQRGSFATALEEFRSSLELSRRPGTILNIAQCYRQLKDAEEALLHYRSYLSEWGKQNPGQASPHQEEVKGHIRTLTAEVEKERQERERLREQQDREAQPRAPAPAGEAPRRRRVWTWVAAGAAVVAGGVALGLGLWADAGFREFQERGTAPDRVEELRGEVPARGHAATAMYGVAGGLAITSVVLFFVEGRPPTDQARSGSRIGSELAIQPITGTAWGLQVGRQF